MKRFFVSLIIFILSPLSTLALDVPTITAAAKGPNQIILTWSAVSNPGWGYRVEIQSNGDSRYSSYTELSWQNGLSILPPWVTESGGTQEIHTDPSTTSLGWGDDTQCNVYGLKYGTLYNFRARTGGQTDAGVNTYSSYSSVINATTTTPSNIYYVSTSGNDGSNGTSWESAWRHLYYADGQVSAGDLVLVNGGNYASDGIDSVVSGTPGTGRIVFQADYGETVTMTSRQSTYLILLDQNYWVLDGINTSSTSNGSDEPIYISGNRNVLANLEVDASSETGDIWGFVNITGDYNLIHNSYIHDCCGDTFHDQQNSTILDMEDDETDYNTVQYCHLQRGSHDCSYVRGDYNRILNNLMDGGLGMGVEIQMTANYNLVEGNYIVDTAKNFTTGGSVYKPGIEISAEHNTIRRNIIRDGRHDGDAGYNSNGIEMSDVGNPTDNNFVYNNTIVHNGGTGIVFWGGSTNKIKNNLFYDNGVGSYDGASEFLEDSAAGNNDIQYNLFLDVTSGGSENPGADIISWNYGGAVTIAYADSNYADFSNNLNDYSPVFINYNSRSWGNLHLKSTSDLIDQGVSVIDNTWGTISYDDVGAFEHYEISSGASPSASTFRGITPVGCCYP